MASSHTPPLQLLPAQRDYLMFLASFVAKAANNDAAGVAKDWMRVSSLAKRLGVDAFSLERSLLDAVSLIHVFVGVPKSIEAFSAVQEARRHDYSKPVPKTVAQQLWPEECKDTKWAYPNFSRVPTPCPTCADPASTAIRRARATATLGSIYTTAAAPLEKYLQSLHPSFYQGIITHGYGHVMCTTTLRLFELETVAVAILSGTNTPRQLKSHSRGALIVGLPADFLKDMIDEVYDEVWCDDGVHGESVEVLRAVIRDEKRKQAAKQGQAIDPQQVAAEREEEYFQDQIKKSQRMAKQGQQHPFFTAGQKMGVGDVDDEIPASAQRPAAAPANSTAAAAPVAEPAGSKLSEEEVEQTLNNMMRRRARDAAAEVALRKTGATVRSDDRWPIPIHELDPSGMGGMMMPGGGSGGVGGGPGMMMMPGSAAAPSSAFGYFSQGGGAGAGAPGQLMSRL